MRKVSKVDLVQTDMISKGNGAMWTICIDDGYCAWKFSVNKDEKNGQYCIQELADVIGGLLKR
jgi:hypothetical protein